MRKGAHRHCSWIGTAQRSLSLVCFLLPLTFLFAGCQGFFTGVRAHHKAEGAELSTEPFQMPNSLPLMSDSRGKFIEDAGRSVRYLTSKSVAEVVQFYRSELAALGLTESSASKRQSDSSQASLLFWGWPNRARLHVDVGNALRESARARNLREVTVSLDFSD